MVLLRDSWGRGDVGNIDNVNTIVRYSTGLPDYSRIQFHLVAFGFMCGHSKRVVLHMDPIK